MTSTRPLPALPVDAPASSAPATGPGPGQDAVALASLIERHQRMVWRYLRLLGADPHEADDRMQDTFVAFATDRRGSAPQCLPAFLRGIARNLLFAARRRQPLTVEWADAVDALVGSDPEAFDDRRIEALRDCLGTLQGRARLAIECHHVEGLSRRDTASRLGISDEGAKSLLSRARDVLKQCIERRIRTEQPT